MKSHRLFLAPIAALLIAGCTPSLVSALSPLEAAASAEVQCVDQKIAAGITDPVAIGVSCGGIEAGIVLNIASLLESLFTKTADAGPPPAAVSGFLRAHGR